MSLPPYRLPVGDLASNNAPRFTLNLKEGRNPFQALLNVPFSAIWSMRGIPGKTMRIHLQGTDGYTTANRR